MFPCSGISNLNFFMLFPCSGIWNIKFFCAVSVFWNLKFQKKFCGVSVFWNFKFQKHFSAVSVFWNLKFQIVWIPLSSKGKWLIMNDWTSLNWLRKKLWNLSQMLLKSVRILNCWYSSGEFGWRVALIGKCSILTNVFGIVETATSQTFSVWFSNKQADRKLRGNFLRQGGDIGW